MSNFKNPSSIFKGKIEGKSIEDFMGIDYKKEDIKNRKIEIEKKIQELKPFLEGYFFCKEKDKNDNDEFAFIEKERNYFKYNPNINEELSEDINICAALESYATYLLNSKDIKDNKRSFERKDNVSLDDIVNIEIDKNMNYRLAPKMDIGKSDFKLKKIFESTYEDYLIYFENKNEYNNAKCLTKEQWENWKRYNNMKIEILSNMENDKSSLIETKKKLELDKNKDSRNKLRVTINMIKDTKSDMIQTKNRLTPYVEITPAKCPTYTNPLVECIDYKNKIHVENALLLIPTNNITTDYNIIAYDINNALKELKKNKQITKYELELIDAFRHSVGNKTMVADIMEKHKTQIYRDIDKIVTKVIKVLNK